MSLLLLFFPFFPSDSALPDKSIEITLFHDKTNSFSLKKIEIVDLSPESYKMNYAREHKIVIIKKENGENLFKGQFITETNIVTDTRIQGKQSGSSDRVVINPVVLHLPIYKNASEIIILDENGTQLTSISFNLNEYKINYSYKFSCGNGLCDRNENILSCFTDCRPYSVSIYDLNSNKK
jgi:hypothetical protein